MDVTQEEMTPHGGDKGGVIKSYTGYNGGGGAAGGGSQERSLSGMEEQGTVHMAGNSEIAAKNSTEGK